jgi:hypothetical protein
VIFENSVSNHSIIPIRNGVSRMGVPKRSLVTRR